MNLDAMVVRPWTRVGSKEKFLADAMRDLRLCGVKSELGERDGGSCWLAGAGKRPRGL